MTTEQLAEVEYEKAEGQASAGPSLGTLFERVCVRFGARTAVTMGAESATYDELDGMANRIAAALRQQGAGPGSIVAICLDRSIAMVAAMLGVVKSGAAYLPLDASYPAARIAETIEDARPVAVLTTRDLAGQVRSVAADCVFVEDLKDSEINTRFNVAVQDEDAAYVIYTSGSTGTPKGVVVSHRNVTRLLRETQRWFGFSYEDVWTMFHSFAFDFSVWEMWGCLLNGGRLIIVPFALSRSPEEFHALLVRERVTVLNQTPSAFALLDQVDARLPVARLWLRLIIFGGEALVPSSLRGWLERHGDVRPELVNMYGITETTVHVTYRRILAGDARRECESVIGEPIRDLRIHLLDPELRPVADGEEGEICIGGAGVAIGYLNRPALTAERFCADPFGAEGAKLYRSGDLARRREDGELVYLGRHDSQVKINGFRIEPGEIEATLLTYPAILQACVVAQSENGGNARLTAYYVAEDGNEPETKALSDFLAVRLPAHMRPALYQRLAVFPLTPNGKVDRKALPRPYAVNTPVSRARESALEERIAGVWRRVLGVQDVAVEDNFFDVGGTSVLLIAVRTGLQEQLDRQIPVTWMFECSTIRALALRLSEPVGHPATEAAPGAAALQQNVEKQRMAFARARAARKARQ